MPRRKSGRNWFRRNCNSGTMKISEQGFTLIESLLVLSIFLVISSITAFSLIPQYEAQESKQFLTQFQADFFYGQQYAISHQQTVSVVISVDQHYYYMRTSYSLPPFLKRYYSKAVTITPGSLSLSFEFTANGNVNKFGSLFIQCGGKHYTLMVLIGKGRFYVVEE